MLGVGAILICLAGIWFFGHISIQKERSALLAEHAQSLEDLGKLTQQLFLAEEEELDSLLIRIRSDLRADGNWAAQAAPLSKRAPSLNASEEISPKQFEVQLGAAVTGDRWRMVRADLKRGLSGRADLRGLELVVADQAGLTAVRVVRTRDGVSEEFDDPRADKGIAKSIWYADEVRRAVAANGRRLERGTFSTSGVGESERTIIRVALGLHAPSELVQGVLVATVDVAPVADSLAALAGTGIDSRILSLDGRALSSSKRVSPPTGTESEAITQTGPERDVSLASRISAQETREGAFEADQYLVSGFPLLRSDGGLSESIVLMETRLPPADLMAQASTPWGIGLIALTIFSGLAIVFLIRRGSVKDSASQENSTAPDTKTRSLEAGATDAEEALAEPSPATGEPLAALARQSIVLRDWLGDVRGCLERDAATRGLSLNLKCERSLPQLIEQDPAWLGGLLIAMGQEALDATSEERVIVRVREDAHEVLRFEVDAGPIELKPVEGMVALGNELGGHFESGRDGGLAFLMPLSAN